MGRLTIMTVEGIDGFEKNGTVYLRLENVAVGLGFTDNSKGTKYVRWNTVRKYLREIGFSQEVAKDTFIPENVFYRLAMKAKNEVAEKFQAKIADEVVPSIRRTGGYMTPEAQAQLTDIVRAQTDIVRNQTELFKTQTALSEMVGTLARKVAEMEENKPAVVYPKDPPVVSLSGLAKLIATTRRVMMDMGSSPEDIGKVTRSIMNTCGFNLPEFKPPFFIDLNLADFFK